LIIEREAFEADLYTIFQHRLRLQHYEPIPFHRTGGFHSTVFATAIAAKQHLPIESTFIIVGVYSIHDQPLCSSISFNKADADPGTVDRAITVSPCQT
jgi:hypothetical protein